MNPDKAKVVYSGWHKFSVEANAAPAEQLDIEAEIERRVAERMATKKPSKPKLVEPTE